MSPGEFDVEIIEAHHRLKADGPSGTALEIARRVCRIWDVDPDKAIQFGWYGKTGERPRGKIGISVIRGGSIVGKHTIIFSGAGEHIEFTHEAESKEAFARGAIKAALWVIGKKNGLYDMSNVLGIK